MTLHSCIFSLISHTTSYIYTLSLHHIALLLLLHHHSLRFVIFTFCYSNHLQCLQLLLLVSYCNDSCYCFDLKFNIYHVYEYILVLVSESLPYLQLLLFIESLHSFSCLLSCPTLCCYYYITTHSGLIL